MQGEKKNFIKYLAFLWIPFFAVFISIVYAGDSVVEVFTSQSATASGSNNSIISVDSNLSYINKWDNSSVIGNYFKGYYYDSILGYFQTDWSSNPLENVRVRSSTSACGTAYGYKLWWYAYSTAFWFVDFDYNSSVFVYYCVDDASLHWYAYNETLGFQNFEGISFDIRVSAALDPVVPTGTGVFVNDNTNIIESIPPSSPGNNGGWSNSNFDGNSIQNDIIKFESQKESLFYIIK